MQPGMQMQPGMGGYNMSSYNAVNTQNVTNVTNVTNIINEAPNGPRKDEEGNIIHENQPQQCIVEGKTYWNPLGPGKNCQVDECGM